MMRERIAQGDTAENAAQRLIATLHKKGPQALAKGTGDPRHRTIDSVLQSSLELLTSQDRAHLIELSIFPEDIAIPLTAASALWGSDDFEAEDIAQRFARLSLLKLDLAHGSMRLHDVMQSWLAAAASNAAELHSRLIGAWPDWMHLPDNYAWRWLPWHLHKSSRCGELEKLLWNPSWLRAKLEAIDANAVIADLDMLQPSQEVRWLQGALRLSSHILAKHPTQFSSQMVGRLLSLGGNDRIQEFLDSAREG